MRRIIFLLWFLLLVFGLHAQTTITGSISTSGGTCSPATSCVTLALPSGTGTVTAQVTGTFVATLQFEGSPDNSSWSSIKATPIPTSTAVSSTTTTGNWVVRTGGNFYVRLRASAYTSGTPTVTINAQNSVIVNNPGTNPCAGANAIKVLTGTTSGTNAVQIIPSSGSTSVYLCSMSVTGVSGTTPTFSLVQGTGVNCATGQSSYFSPFATVSGNTYSFVSPYTVNVAAPYINYQLGGSVISGVGNAICYFDGGTLPVQSYVLTYVQQ